MVPDGWEQQMNKHLDEAITQVKSRPEEGQREAAELLFEFLDQQSSEVRLTQEQVAEIERRLGDDEPYASDQEVRDLYARLTR
jgi:hypothetical protein